MFRFALSLVDITRTRQRLVVLMIHSSFPLELLLFLLPGGNSPLYSVNYHSLIVIVNLPMNTPHPLYY